MPHPVAVASANPTTGTAPLEVTFNGSDSTDDVAVVSYIWDFKDGTPVSSLANPVHTFTIAGVYNVELTVQDDQGLTATTTVLINVNSANNAPPVAIASANPISGDIPLEVTFTGDGSTDDVAVVSYLWDFNDGSATVTDPNPTHTFNQAGTYMVELTVADAEGLTDMTTISITASPPGNDAPEAVLDASPIDGMAPLQVSFTGSNSSDDKGIASYLWDFNDGTPSSAEADPKHTFINPGSYTVSLTVADDEGLMDIENVTINVIEPTPEKEINAMLIVNPAKQLAQVQFIDRGPADRRITKIYLHDSSGRLLEAYNPGEIFAHGLFEIPISTLSDGGIYYIGFEMNRGDRVVLSLIVKN